MGSQRAIHSRKLFITDRAVPDANMGLLTHDPIRVASGSTEKLEAC